MHSPLLIGGKRSSQDPGPQPRGLFKNTAAETQVLDPETAKELQYTHLAPMGGRVLWLSRSISGRGTPW